MNNNPTVICRKCSGPHFTIKCGKTKPEIVQNNIPSENGQALSVEERKAKYASKFKSDETVNDSRREKRLAQNSHFYNDNNTTNTNTNTTNTNTNKERTFRKTYRVKLAELPNDITEEELMELTCDWGHVVKLRVLNYNENSTAYIDFSTNEQADYFVSAIDKTPFDSILLSAIRVDSLR